MEQTIKINVPEGKVAKYNETTQTIEFVDKEPVRSKSWEEFCENHPRINNEYFITTDCEVDDYKSSVRITCDDKNLLSSKEDAEGIIALIQLTRLHDEWVGDWKPVETFYSITHSKYTGNLIVECYNHRLLIFPTYDMAVEFLECFKDLIETAKKFI